MLLLIWSVQESVWISIFVMAILQGRGSIGRRILKSLTIPHIICVVKIGIIQLLERIVPWIIIVL